MARRTSFLWALPFLLLLSGARGEDEMDRKEKLRYLIMDLQEATERADFSGLEKLLPPVFKYSFGGDDTRAGAIRYYRENPAKLGTLNRILAQGCKRQGPSHFACPPQSADNDVIYLGPRAGFAYDDAQGKWAVVYFVEGD